MAGIPRAAGASVPLPQGVTAQAVQAQLDKLLGSSRFARAPRLSRLLRYLVERTLAGQTEDLKESLLGGAVFDKPQGFDPAADPIVRVEAGRLRERLRSYYQAEGRGDELLIRLPKGGYVPLFQKRRSAAAARPGEPARRPSPAARKRLLILPFRDFSEGGAGAFLAEGLVEDLTTALSKVPALRVVARRSTHRYAARPADVRRICQELGADLVIEGSIRKAAAAVRICVRLAESRQGTYLWSEIFDFPESQLAAAHQRISEAVIAAALPSRRVRADALPGPAAQNSQAYLLSLKGRHHVRRRSRQELLKGIRLLEQALELEPHAATLATLAEAHVMLAWYGFAAAQAVMPRALMAAERAVAMDPSLAQAHLALGLVRELYQWDWRGAETHFRTACRLDPSDATAWFELALCVSRTGGFSQGVELMRLAVRADPLSPLVHTNLGVCLYYQRSFAEGLRSLLEALDLNPDYFPAHFRLGMTHLAMGNLGEAIASLERARSLCEACPTVSGLLGYALGLAGDRGAAQEMLRRIATPADFGYVRPTAMALVHLGLKDHDRAVACLERARAERDLLLADIQADPIFDPLRAESHFRDLTREVFPEA